ncbi:MAG TPA: hypothetical protein VEB41_01115 [Burkholderiales bacterium]|nr:hypothetical protein [Burkholderiales bacterium]
MVARINANIDPLAGKLRETSLQEQDRALRRANEIAELRHQLDLLKLQQDVMAQTGKTTGSSPQYSPPQGAATPDPKQTADVATLAAKIAEIEKELRALVSKPLGLDGPIQKPALASPSDVHQSQAQSTSKDIFEDQSSYRDLINSRIRERQLDDAHDLAGFTLYEFKFDVTFAPGNNTQRYALLWFSLVNPYDKGDGSALRTAAEELDKSIASQLTGSNGQQPDAAEVALKKFFAPTGRSHPRRISWKLNEAGPVAAAWQDLSPRYFAWVDQLQATLIDDQINLQLRQESASVTRKALATLQDHQAREWCDQQVAKKPERVGIAEASRIGPFVPFGPAGAALFVPNLAYLETLRGSRAPGPLVVDDPRTKCALSYHSYRIFHEAFADLVDIEKPAPFEIRSAGSTNSRTWFVSSVRGTTEKFSPESIKKDPNKYAATFLQSVRGMLGVLKSDQQPWIANIEPKEYAQNISDVSSRENLRNLMLGLGATASKGASLEAFVQSIQDSQALLHAIQRQPLAISVSNAQNVFGWLLGPKYAIRNGQAVFVHSPVRHTFTVSAVVPSWWSRVGLKAEGVWIDENGQLAETFEPWSANPGKASLADKNAGFPADRPKSPLVNVELPSTVNGFSTTLFAAHGLTLREPRINTAELSFRPESSFVMQEGAGAQSIRIRGRELWRNPDVFVGGQRADVVEVMPDMNGLVATFNAIRVPARPVNLDLAVVTSFGEDVLPSAISVLPARQRESRFARLASRQFDTRNPVVVFDTTPTDVPRGYAELRLRLRPIVADSPWVDLAAAPTWTTTGRLEFRATEEEVKKLVTAVGARVVAELLPDLRMRTTPGADPFSVLAAEPVPMAFVPNPAKAQLKLATKTLEYLPNGAPKPDQIQLSLPDGVELNDFQRAYLDLEAAMAGGKLSLSLFEGDQQLVVLPLELRGRRLLVERAHLVLQRTKLAPEATDKDESKDLTLRVNYGDDKSGGAIASDVSILTVIQRKKK